MDSLLIRDARPGDREAILDATLSAYREYAAPMGPHWEDYRRDILDTLANPEPAEQIVAQKEGVLAGSVLLFPAGTVFPHRETLPAPLEWPEVRLLAVAPKARGRGIGTALMRECIRRATRAGAPFLALHTTDRMKVAQGMYRRMGFQRAPALDFHFDETTVKGYRLKLGREAGPGFERSGG